MKIAVLTSSRADFSIYYPLLTKLQTDSFFLTDIIAFHTHLSEKYGYTANYITEQGFKIKHKINTLPPGDLPQDISSSMGLTISKISSLWVSEKYDLVFALGDRYEMFAAVASTVPFNINIAHIHGGETTIGSIDNAFRNSITLMSKYHFTSTQVYKNRVIELTGNEENIYNVGALSIDNLKNIKLYSKNEFKKVFNIDLNIPSILITFHPETVSYEKNNVYIEELISALQKINDYQLIITMPNADTMGNIIRNKLNEFIKSSTNVFGIETFGTIGYLSCMKHCRFMLGNTSSGFVEASFFPKYVINLGERQKGRIITSNIINCNINEAAILSKIREVEKLPEPDKINIYGTGNTANNIIKILKTL